MTLSIFLLSGQIASAAKVNVTPTPVTLTEGQSQTISITLDSPIIGPGPGAAYFNLNPIPGDVSRITVSPSIVSYTAADWFQVKTFSITAVDDAVVNGNISSNVSMTVDSDSVYYNGFLVSIPVTVNDNDVAVTTSESPSEAALQANKVAKADSLADTGTSSFVNINILILMTSIFTIIRLRRKQNS